MKSVTRKTKRQSNAVKAKTKKGSNKITLAERRLLELFSQKTTLEIGIAYDKCGADLTFKALIDVDERDLFTVLHEVWRSDDCLMKKIYHFAYIEDESTGRAAEFFDKIELELNPCIVEY